MVKIKRRISDLSSSRAAPKSLEVSETSFLHELPKQFQDPRFMAAFRILSRHVDCDESKQQAHLKAAEDARQTTAIVNCFFRLATIALFEDKEKLYRLRERARLAYERDPDGFMNVVLMRRNEKDALLPGGKLTDIFFYVENCPEAAKLAYLLYFACMYFMSPIVSFSSIGIDNKKIKRFLDYCINIDLKRLGEELKRCTIGFE